MLDHIDQIPAHAALTFKDKEALVFEGQSFTFNDLNVLIEKTAGGLHSLGINQGDVVPLYAFNSCEWIVSYFAIARIGAVIFVRHAFNWENLRLDPRMDEILSAVGL